MPTTVLNYLHVCHGKFAEVSEKLYITPFDLPAIERSVRHLRNRNFLTYKDLRYFTAPEHWWFEKFWVFPPKEHLTPALLKITFNFGQLPGEEKKVLAVLLAAFKSIELVSVILRFVRPEHYGIISPPVERVLDVRRGSDAVDTYLNYLSDLRMIRHRYRFKQVADADMALWSLHELCFGRHKDPKIKKEYESDSFMLGLRAKNLVSPLPNLSFPKLAQALMNANPDLAALVGCYAFELLVREYSGKNGVKPLDKLSQTIEALYNHGIITGAKMNQWIDLKRIRDGLFHEGQKPSSTDIEDLIKEVVRLETLYTLKG